MNECVLYVDDLRCPAMGQGEGRAYLSIYSTVHNAAQKPLIIVAQAQITKRSSANFEIEPPGLVTSKRCERKEHPAPISMHFADGKRKGWTAAGGDGV